MIDRRLNIADTGLCVEASHQIEGALPFGVGLIGEFDARLEPPKKIRHQRKKSVGGQCVRCCAHRTVDAEYFLYDDDARAASGGGDSQITGERAVGPVDGDLLTGHGAIPLRFAETLVRRSEAG